MSAPLHLESVRTGSRCTSSEVEAFRTVCDRALHARPIEQHVGRLSVVSTERAGPRHLEFVAKSKTTSTGDRLTGEIGAREPAILRELFRDCAKKCEWLSRRSQIAHVSSEYREKRRDLLGAEFHRHALLLRPANLGAQLRIESLEENVSLVRQIEHNGDFAMGNAK